MENKSVFILHRDVDFEFGHVVAVFSTKEKAEQGLENVCKGSCKRDQLSIEEWAIDDVDL